MRRISTLAVLPAMLAVLVGSAASAVASPAETREVISGEVLRLVSVQDRPAMSTMAPGEPVAWDVQVSANRPDGEIALSLTATGAEGAFEVQVAECGAEGTACTEQLIGPTTVGATPVELGTQPAAEQVWYRITTELITPEHGAEHGAELALRFVAAGSGEEVSAGGGGDLPATGGPHRGLVLAALIAVACGVLLRFGGALVASSRVHVAGSEGGPRLPGERRW
ncbi:hypothetical protein IM660_19570 [Ruania alkalisoli]|uniref:Uncharacterized protein n=1 Tax=Ruania alkalisoli TaxID=2779775 RepID=A0A7M1SUK2_9MICO|nr:hypothetical protein [Ruania alkalisoli]QOR70737.1 hypothetical protein IM660_19570 [Ruania alkalisoli]